MVTPDHVCIELPCLRLDAPGISEDTAEVLITVHAYTQSFVIFLKLPERQFTVDRQTFK